MIVFDGMMKVGRYRLIRPVVSFILSWLARIPFHLLVKISGRRLVSGPVAAPAILLTGSNLKNAPQNAELLYRAMRFTVESMHMDTYCMMADLSVEAEACGCQIVFDNDNVPSIQSHIIDSDDDIRNLQVPDPYHAGRMPVFLECMRMLKRHCMGLRMGCITGPFTLALNLRGSGIYIDTIKNPEMINNLMDFTTEVGLRYARALVKAGADMIIIAEPACSQLSAKFFTEISLPHLEKLAGSINRHIILHICGNINHLIQPICHTSASVLSVDEVDLMKLMDEAPSSLVIAGNISPRKIFMESPEEITRVTGDLVQAVTKRKSFIIAPGCDLPPQTPLENIHAFVKAVNPNV